MNNIFTGNRAEYGPDVASYAVRIVQTSNANSNIKITNVGSGLTLQESPADGSLSSIELALVDFDNQVMVLEDTSKITIIATTPNASVIGFNSASINSGVATFTSMGFVHKPGSENIIYMSNSDEIDGTKVSYLSLPTDNTLSISFRS